MAPDPAPNAAPGPPRESGEGSVRVRLWASARAAAGTPELTLDLHGEVTVGRLRSLVAEALPGRPGLPRVLGVCSVLLGEEPVHDDAAVVPPGVTVEFLPPFAGG